MIVCAFLIATPAFAEQFNIEHISFEPRTLKAYNKDDGKFLWQGIVFASTEEVKGKTLLRITERYNGIQNGKEKGRWTVNSYYEQNGGSIIPLNSMRTFFDSEGATSETLEKIYSKKDGKVYCLKNGDKKTFDFEDDLVDKELLGTCLMNYPYDRKDDLEFHMMTNEPSHYKMTMINRGKESLTVNGATVECYKLQMVPDLGMLALLGAFVPKTYFWYKVQAPHEFVRYEGLESGLNTPYIVLKTAE
jgi:hypothetical protein